MKKGWDNAKEIKKWLKSDGASFYSFTDVVCPIRFWRPDSLRFGKWRLGFGLWGCVCLVGFHKTCKLYSNQLSTLVDYFVLGLEESLPLLYLFTLTLSLSTVFVNFNSTFIEQKLSITVLYFFYFFNNSTKIIIIYYTSNSIFFLDN